MVSQQMGEVREGIAVANRQASELPPPSLEEMRRGVLDFLRTFPEVPGAEIVEVEIDGVKAEWTMPEDVSSDSGVVLYLHGGGYIQGSPVGHRRIVTTLAKRAGLRALSVDYRLAPEDPYPAGLDDTVAAYEWLISTGGVDPSRIVVAGDSAGGGLAASLLLRLRDGGRPLPAGAFLISPHLTFADGGQSMVTRQSVDPFFGGGTELIKMIQDLYVPLGNVEDPYVSPSTADLSGLPPVLIHVGDYEVLLDHSNQFGRGAASAGVEAQVVVWPEAFHVFHFYVGIIPEADDALADAGEWIAHRVS